MSPHSVSTFRRLTGALALFIVGLSACTEPGAPPSSPGDAIVRVDIGVVTPRWTVSELPILPGSHSAQVLDISDNGRVVGHSWGGSSGSIGVIHHPFYWTQSAGIKELPTTGYTDGQATAVSDNGVYVAGTVGNGAAVRWSFGHGIPTLTVLPRCSLNNTRAFGVNNAGVVVGISSNYAGSTAVKWTSATACPTPLYVAGTAMYGARAINDGGAIVGLGFTPSRGFMTGSIFIPPKLPPLAGDTHSDAQGVNDNNEVVGTSSNGSTHTAIYRSPITTDIIALGSTWGTVAVRISDKGRIVWPSGSGGRSSKGTALYFLSIIPYNVNACGDIVGMLPNGKPGLYKKSVCD